MTFGITQLEKLRGKGLREFRVRGAQELAKLNERIFGAGTIEMTDEALLREINSLSRNGNGEGSAMLILERIRSSTTAANRSSTGLPFFASLARREDVSAIIKQHFPDERAALLERAERAIRGRFDLLGFSDLSFGDPIDWHLDPTTGKRTPLVHWSKIDYLDPDVAGDKKIIWELNRHAHFVTLGQAYWLTGDERFAEAFVSQASSWIDANPPKLGINWASSLELSFRVMAWLWALHLFADSDRLSPRFVSRFFKYLVAQGRHIESYLSHYFSPNTHLTGEALGLFYLGAALPELERAGRWREKGLGVLLEKLPKHICDDGVYFERSSYYHRYTVDFYVHLFVLARAAKVSLPGEVEHRLSSALDHLMFITRPDGASPLYGDDDGGRLITLNIRPADDFRDTLATGAALFGRSDWKFVSGKAAVETLWLLGPDAIGHYDGIEAIAPVERSRAFDKSGYFVMRDGWSAQSSYVLAECGKHGSESSAHAHADALALEFAAEGKTWLIDPGTFTYTGDAALRDQFRTSKAHNTATVDGQPQSVPSGPFGWTQIAQPSVHQFTVEAAVDYFQGSHDGYERLADPVTHTRSLLFLKKEEACELPPFLIVRDQFNARQRHSYELRYHLTPGSSATSRDNEVNASDAADRALSIRVFGEKDPRARIEQGWVSRCYGQRESAPVAVFETEDEGPRQLVSFIIPKNTCRAGSGWPILAEEHATPSTDGVEGRPYRSFSISAGASRDVVLIAQQANGLKHELFSATGSMAWARFIDGGFRRGCLIGGRSFRVPRCVILNSPADIGSCTIGIDNDQLEISIRGATRFDLSLGNAPSGIVVNDFSFDLPPGPQTVAFALEASGWKLAGKD
jgi:uncharacterized heparinase superfamily protein